MGLIALSESLRQGAQHITTTTALEPISLKTIGAITNPDVAAEVAADLQKVATFAAGHAAHVRAMAYQTPWTATDQQRLDEAREDAPAVLSLAGAVARVTAAQTAQTEAMKDRAARHRERDQDLEKIRSGEIRIGQDAGTGAAAREGRRV